MDAKWNKDLKKKGRTIKIIEENVQHMLEI